MSDKVYRIGEAAELLALKAYVLRFWETEFPQLVPVRTDKGQRLYSEENIALLRRIKYLLHEQGLTIEGARRVLASGPASGVQSPDYGAGFAAQTEPLAPAPVQTQLPSGPELSYTSNQTISRSENDPAATQNAARSAGRDDEFAAIDPAMLEEVIDGLEEVRRMLLPRR